MKDKTGKDRSRSSVARNRGSGSKYVAANPRENRMAGQSSRLGNEEFKQRLDASNASRDDMLKFLKSRMGVINEVQQRELSQMGTRNQRNWWKEVADSHKGISKPEPKRWHEAAKLYELAAEQLCNGKVGRGREVLESAMRAEQEAFDNLTKLVSTEDLEKEAAENAPESMWEVKPHQACTPIELPPELQELANRILDVGQEIKDPPVKKRVADPWWTEEEEEEEEEDADGGS